MTLGERIRQYRGENGLTQMQFAEMCGVGWLTILSIEKERQKPNAGTEVKILKVIGKE